MKPRVLIIGLGNPGVQYARTRHNLGYMALDRLAMAWNASEWLEEPKFLCESAEAQVDQVPVLLVKPLTYMNRSGECVRKLVDFYKLNPATQVLVLVDEIDLPLGTVRLKPSGGPGTHNGLRSLYEHFGEGYARLRIGMNTENRAGDLAAWVLSIPPPTEQKVFEEVLATVPAMVEKFVVGK